MTDKRVRRRSKAAPQRARISDVAARAGVSTATVSRVLNDPESVSPERRRLVLDAVAELSYTPNVIARNLRGSVTTIGAIVVDLDNEPNRIFVRAAADYAELHGLDFVVRDARGRPADAEVHFERLVAQRVSGILLAGPLHISERILALRSVESIPVVPGCALDSDALRTERARSEIGAIGDAVNDLAESGHEIICVLDLLRAGSSWRESAFFRDELLTEQADARGMSFVRLLSNDQTEMVAQIRSRQSDGGRIAYVAANQMSLPTVIRSLREAHVVIPDDASLVAFGDSELARLASPSVSAICRDMYQEGFRQTELLVALIGGDAAAPEFEYEPTRFVRRGSTSVISP